MDMPDVSGVSGETIPDSVPQVVHLAVGVSPCCTIMTGRIVVAGVRGVWCDGNGFEICSWGIVVDVGCLDTLPRSPFFFRAVLEPAVVSPPKVAYSTSHSWEMRLS